jgi:pyrroloquinoline quinone (PQQ) biosynthesis protein C
MMEEAAAAARHLAGEGSDPTAPLLAEYFERHAREEAGHDDWLLDDLEALGVAREAVWERIPSRHVAAMVGAYYYWVRHVHPVALLSYLAVLEGNPPVVEQLESVQRSTGLPREAFRTLIKHAHLDPHHRDDLNDLIDRLPLTAEHHQLLALSAFHTIEQVSLVLQEVLDSRRH